MLVAGPDGTGLQPDGDGSLGLPTGVAPADLVSLQEIIHQVRPDAIISVGTERGLVGFVDSTAHAVGIDGARILHLAHAEAAAPHSARITPLHGAPDDPSSAAAARNWAATAEMVLVLLDVSGMEDVSPATLQAWGRLVSHRSYLVCLGSVFGQPWLGYSSRQHFKAIREFTAGDSPFVVDRSLTRQLVSTSPFGYLRKVGGITSAASYDDALDNLAPDQPALLENPQ